MDEVPHPVPRHVLPISMPVKEPYRRHACGQHLVLRSKFFQQVADERSSTKAASEVNFEAAFFTILPIPYCRNKPDVCNPGQSVLLAAGKVDFEFPREVLAHRIPQEEPGDCSRIWRRVERFVGADACEMAAHHVSYAVAAGFPGCKTDFD